MIKDDKAMNSDDYMLVCAIISNSRVALQSDRMVELFVPIESGNQAFLRGGRQSGMPLLSGGLQEDRANAARLFESRS